MPDEMAEAVQNQARHILDSHAVNRTGWTRQQWVDDARRLMGDLDGSVLDLVNGHVMHLIGALTDKDAAIAEARADERRNTAEQFIALSDTWQAELDSGAIRDPNARYCWQLAVREIRQIIARDEAGGGQ